MAMPAMLLLLLLLPAYVRVASSGLAYSPSAPSAYQPTIPMHRLLALAPTIAILSGVVTPARGDNGHTSAWSAGSPEFNCKIRLLAYEFGQRMLPRYGRFADLYYALGLNDGTCGNILPETPAFTAVDYDLNTPPPSYCENAHVAEQPDAAVYFVDAAHGNDASSTGGLQAPFKTVQRAVDAAAIAGGGGAEATINLRAGRHYLGSTVQLSEANSNLVIQNYRGERAVVSGAVHLDGPWHRYTPNVGGGAGARESTNMYTLNTSGFGLQNVPGFQVNGVRVTRARYPNGNMELPEADKDAGNPLGPSFISQADTNYVLPDYSIKAEKYTNNDPAYFRNKSVDNRWGKYTVGYGGQCAIFDPPVSYWCSNESAGGGGVEFVMFRGLQPNATKNHSIGLHTPYKSMDDAIVHVKHPASWSNYMFSVRDYDPATSMITFNKGGFQGSRGVGMGKVHPGRGGDWFVDNVFEEFDAPNEFFWDKVQQKLYFYYNGTGAPPADADYDVPQLTTLFNLTAASRHRPIQNVTLRGFTMTGTRHTYMEPHAVPSGGDMAVARLAAVFLEGTEGVVISDCTLTRLDGNGIMVSGYNRDALIENNTLSWIGSNAVVAWGRTNETAADRFQGFDGTDGNHPLRTTLSQNLIREIGKYEKQSGWFFQAKSAKTLVARNVMFNAPRSGITMNDGFGGGDRLYNNLLFSALMETCDAGPVNSWDRQPFLTTYAHDGAPSTDMVTREVAHNLIFANYNGQETLDHDDGTLSYVSHDNVHVSGQHAFKLGQGDNVHFGDVYVYVLPCTGSSYCRASASWSQLFQGGGPTSVAHPDAFYNNTVLVQNYSSFDCNTCPGSSNFPVFYDNSFFVPDGGKAGLPSTRCKMNFSGWNGTTAHPLPADDTVIAWARAKLFMPVSPEPEGPCDITGKAGNPCVAAHSTTRALYGSYRGPLYRLLRTSDGKRIDVGVLAAGGFANITTHDAFCPKMDCVISDVYDQSPQKNHLYQRLELINASKHKISVRGGVEVYGMWFDAGHGYHCDNTTGVAKGNDPESIYAVMAGNRDPSELGRCCFDYGNSENSVLAHNGSDGAGTMEAIYFGNARWHANRGDNSKFDGPWVGADLEAGMYYGGGNYTQVNPHNKPLRMPFVSAYLRGDTDGMVLKGGDATKGPFLTMYDGPRPLCSIATTCHDHKTVNPHAGYQPMNKKGAIILATGGDTSSHGVGNFYEGMMVTGATTDATDDAVKANTVAVDYKIIE